MPPSLKTGRDHSAPGLRISWNCAEAASILLHRTEPFVKPSIRPVLSVAAILVERKMRYLSLDHKHFATVNFDT